ncbi:helix-turn-helix domain-containing protein [Acerihabitans sp. TG2]|uniref:GlxA family transcriptional regulator n=1 Tax=Acerihabitans sp. TG2 TaxID=3096008 RepID=UPI002B2228C6|nr:helix-turn-helix domain-containing protein [Acerihabitans sp. TG2]MEA9389948.1 helix-turn-helix domain-containing protein [Acerihabitans sp. TG2]
MRDVYFLVLPYVMSLDLTGPAEVLALSGAFRLHYCGPQEEVPTSTGMTISQIGPLPEELPPGSIVVIPGVIDSRHQFDLAPALAAQAWLSRHRQAIHDQTWMLVCVCSGALLAARAGLLDGYRCTSHHDVLARLREQAPAAQVKENRIFVEDRGIYTSAGITAGIDLALYLVGQWVGAQQAMSVAREMVVYFRRGGDDAQLSPWLCHRNHLHPAVHRAQDILSREPEAEWHLAQLASQVFMSSRHLTRLFREHLGISVREYHEQLRLAVAQQRLQQGLGIEKSALAAGFSSSRQLRRAQQRKQTQAG